jgi:hypothetical protein
MLKKGEIIEDIVGLSYFDEKKEESLKQLEESDTRLDIALARMNEIRKRIDDLEIERNEQLRFQHIERDIKKYKAKIPFRSRIWYGTGLDTESKKLISKPQFRYSWIPIFISMVVFFIIFKSGTVSLIFDL